jgi:diaminopimelate epimerase
MRGSDVTAIPIIKAHAFGNDFLLVDAERAREWTDVAVVARRLCDRHRGIGGDGLMLLTPTASGAETRLFNADGSVAEVSGNGVRCAAAWIAHDRAIAPGASVVIGTAAGPKRLELLERHQLRSTFKAEMGPPEDLRTETISVAGQRVQAIVLRVGNPQCVLLGPATEDRLHGLAAPLAVHPFFPHGTNVELAEIESPDRVRILIWERGVGPTEASGTGACAAAVAAAFAGGANRSTEVVSPGGAQWVEWTDHTIWLTGWAELVARIDWWGAA